LNERYKLRRAGRITQANELAVKINTLVSSSTRTRYNSLSTASPKTLWREVNNASRPSTNAVFINKTEPDTFNNFFAGISFDNSKPTSYSCLMSENCNFDTTPLNEFEVERQLRTLKNTSPGSDNIPTWVFRHCSVELSGIITVLFNQSICSGIVPVEWLNAIVTPVPKVDKPSSLTDYRPISVTPILSRVAERLIAKKYLQPSLLNDATTDQYAFKPSGSTTAALVHILHRVSEYLEHCNYVRCLLIDFSRAFDVIDRSILLHKLSLLDISNNIKCWISNFLSERCQQTRCNGNLSLSKPVNLGVVQGSALGPLLFTLMVSDLKTLSTVNELVKFADDTTLLVPELTDTDISEEFNCIKLWAAENKMIINLLKTKEIVFHRPRPAKPILPPCLTDIERVTVAKLLGVYLKGNFSFSEHVDFIIRQCRQRMYLLRLLRNRGLPAAPLEAVFTAIVLSRILYAVSAWGGFVNASEEQRLNKILCKSKSYGYCKNASSFDVLLERADTVLFSKAQNTGHCLQHLLPAVRSSTAVLRNRGHPLVLPTCKYELYKRSFLTRCLFKYI
jgi:hypothetical protein